MTSLLFPVTRLVPEPDLTELAIQRIAEIALDFETAASETTSVSRCVQLHQRLYAIAQIIEAADGTIRQKWDQLLASGKD